MSSGPQTMLAQRQAGPPGSGFQNMANARGSTPSGKRPQESRNQMPNNPPKR